MRSLGWRAAGTLWGALVLAGCPARPMDQAASAVHRGTAAAPSASRAAAPPAPRPTAQVERLLTPAQVATVGLQTVQVRRGAVPAPLVLSGRLAFDNLQVAHVVPPVNGVVTQVLAEEGQHVRRGQALATLESPELGAVVADAESSRADLLAAERNLLRSQALYNDRAVAEKELEGAKRRFAEAQAENRRAQDKSRLLGGREGQDSATYVLRAPMDGNVISRNIWVGSDVQGQYENGPTAPELFTLGSLGSVWALADVFEMDLPRIRTGDGAKIHVVAYPDKVFPGRVDWISPVVDPETRTTQVRCRLDNQHRLLKPEMFITMVIATAGTPGVLVPRSAIFYLHGQYYVYEQANTDAPGGDLRFVRRQIVPQEDADNDEVAVLSGLRGDERIVAQGGLLLEEVDAAP